MTSYDGLQIVSGMDSQRQVQCGAQSESAPRLCAVFANRSTSMFFAQSRWKCDWITSVTGDKCGHAF